ncbi:hypothetical protein PSO31014_03725 [Pandoraea soli]|uniref:Uncharacterized protein n=2 Tax=Pandoraea soli TaxID=2508293 RepID=A0ABY6W6M2_9BURK|nr:hypothetical protein PSO31014_03725 [Pandoraea soli]
MGRWFFPFVLLATLLQNYYDLAALMTQGSLALYTYTGPIAYKLGKDIAYLILLVSIVWVARKSGRTPLVDYALGLVVLVLLQWAISVLVNGPLVATIGLRWVTPFILFLLMRDWVNGIDKRAAARWVLWGMYVCLAVQAVQLFTMPPVFGEVLPGVPARTPGIFIVPNSTSLFGCASAALLIVLRGDSRAKCWYFVFLAGMISALSQSGAGIVTVALLALCVFCKRRINLFALLMLLSVLLLVPSLNILTQRADFVQLSGGGRLKVLWDMLSGASFGISNFGVYTNAANLVSENPAAQVAPDSLVASWIGNFGAFWIFGALLTALFVKFRMTQVDWIRAMPAVIVLACFSMTTIVFEAFPMNLYLAVALWSALKMKPVAAQPEQLAGI